MLKYSGYNKINSKELEDKQTFSQNSSFFVENAKKLQFMIQTFVQCEFSVLTQEKNEN